MSFVCCPQTLRWHFQSIFLKNGHRFESQIRSCDWSCVWSIGPAALGAMWRWLTWLITILEMKKDSELATHPLTALVMGLYDSLWGGWRPTWQAHRHHSIMWIRGVALNLPSHHRGLNHTLLWNVWDCERVRLTIDTSVSLLIKEFSWFASRGKKNGKFD